MAQTISSEELAHRKFLKAVVVNSFNWWLIIDSTFTETQDTPVNITRRESLKSALYLRLAQNSQKVLKYAQEVIKNSEKRFELPKGCQLF